jgi:hypothetical protein
MKAGLWLNPFHYQIAIVVHSSYKTTPKWHGFLTIKLAALAAGGWAEQRTAEYRTAACDELSRVEYRRMVSLRSVSF